MSWFGGNKKDKGNGRSQTKDTPSHNTRFGGQGPSPTRNQRRGGAAQHVEDMDCGDPYMTSNSAYGAGSGFGNQYDHHGRHGYQPHHQHHGHGIGQAQEQGHIFRSAQASKQMVYEVYGNCLAMLEELESRELKMMELKPLPRSDIDIPDQKKFDFDTIQRKLETQLLLFQSQLVSCDKEIKDEVRQELKENTLVWNSQREERKVPDGRTDRFAGKLFEILEKGKTEHPKAFYERPSIDQEGMQNVMQALVQGDHRRGKLDEDFRKDSEKKAQAPRVRGGPGVGDGADRMARNNPHLAENMEHYGDLKLC